VEGDCLELIQKLKSKTIHDNFVGLVVKDILDLIESFSFYSWSYIKRGENKVAHVQAHWQPFSFDSRIWEFDAPENIVSQASNDMYVHIDSNLI